MSDKSKVFNLRNEVICAQFGDEGKPVFKVLKE